MLLDLLLDALDRGRTLLAAAHQHDALDDIVFRILAGDAEPRLMPHDDGRNIPHQHRVAVTLRQHRIVELLDRANEADTAHHGRLGAEIDDVAADIDVAVRQRLENLRKRQAIGDQLVEIDLQLERLGLAAPADDVDDARYRAEPPLQHPILQGLEVEHAVAGRADQLIAVDFADRTDRRNLRLCVVQERRQLRETVKTCCSACS